MAELDASGIVVSTFAYADRANTPSLMRRAGSAYRIIADHLGSVRLVVNVATGQIAQRMDYDEFGNVILDTSPGFQPFGFLGGIYDRDTGLVRLGARDYDPVTGRWTAKDPAGFGGGENLYLYGDGDPVNMADVTGEAPFIAIPAFLAAYARCTATCTALAGLSAALLSDCDVDLPTLTGDCASSCLNPLNWLKIDRGATGTIYRVPGSATSSKKPNIGRHNGPNPQANRRSPDGRNRTQAEIVDHYDTNDPLDGRRREQLHMDNEGGLDQLDNRRNEIAPHKRGRLAYDVSRNGSPILGLVFG